MIRKLRKYTLISLLSSSLICCGLMLHHITSNHHQFIYREEHLDISKDFFNFDQKKSTHFYVSDSHPLRDIKYRSSQLLDNHVDYFRRSKSFVKDKKECKTHKFVVYRCDYSLSCGGLGDRQRGIVSSFLLALLSERVLIIDFDKPCELENFLKPYLYDWTVCKAFIKNVGKNDTNEINLMRHTSYFDDFNNFNFSSWHWKVIILNINSNMIYQIRKRKGVLKKYGWLLNKGIPQTYNIILSMLFQPKNNVLSFINTFIQQNVKQKSLVCCHVRIGKNPSIPQDNMFSENEKPNETIVFNHLKQYTDSSKYVIYLASDSLSVREYFWKAFKNGVKFDVPIIHIDRLGKYNKFKEKACEGLKYVLIEQYILSICDLLILTADSGFGKYAAYMRGISENIFLIQLNNSRIVLTDLKHI